MYWHTFLIAKNMSGWVKAKYCKLPTTLLYKWGFSNVVPSNVVSLRDEYIGVETGLALCMLVQWSNSEIYFDWHKYRPWWFMKIWMPRKSLIGNDMPRVDIKSEINLELDLVTIMSSTYMRTKSIWVTVRKINNEVSDFDSWKPRDKSFVLSLENQGRGACFRP